MAEAATSSFDLIDTSEWPILHVTILGPPSHVSEIDVFQAKFLALLRLANSGADGIPAEKICIVFNLDGILRASLEQQIRAASFIKDVREFVNKSIYSTALVIQNETVKTIIEFIFSIQPLQSLNRVFNDTGSALAWSRKNRMRQQNGLEPLYDL